MTNHSSQHEVDSRRTITMADGAIRTIETCTCEAVRITIVFEGETERSDWNHSEARRAG